MNLTVQNGTGSATVLPAANVSNVQVWNIRDVSAGGNTYDFSLFAGETQVVSQNSTKAVTFSNLGDGAAVGVSGSTTGAVTFGKATASDAINVVLNGATGSATILNDASKNADASNVATTATSATITTTAGAAASTTGAIRLTSNASANTPASSGTLTSLNVVAGSDLTATLTAGDFSTTATTVTLNVSGAGKVNLGTEFTGNVINAATNTGGLTITSAASTKTFVGGTGKDVLTLGGKLATTGTVDLGAGNDILSVITTGGSTYVASTNTVDGGAGIDAVSAKLINAGNGAVFKNFEQIDLKGASTTVLDAALLTGSTIQNILVSGDIGVSAATLTGLAAGVNLLVTGAGSLGTANLALANSAGTADSFAINFANTSTTASTSTLAQVGLTGIETINVSSAGTHADTVNAITLLRTEDNSLATINITGANAVTVGNVKTDMGATLAADTASKLTLIDGSTATGDLTITAGASHAAAGVGEVTYTGLTVNTGSGNDKVYAYAKSEVVSTGAGNDTVTTQNFLQSINVGAGNDKVVVGNGSEFNGAYVAGNLAATITGFGVGDKIDVTAQTTAATAVNNFTTTALTKGTLAAAVDAAIAEAGAYQFFNWTDGNTYFVTDGTPANLDLNDSVVALVGTFTSFTNDAGVITLG